MSLAPLRPMSRVHLARAGIVLGLAALQLAAILWVSERGSPLPLPALRQPALTLVPDGRIWMPDDPTLLALPSPSGFAGVAWRNASDPRYEPRDWEEPVRWLAADGQQFGRLLAEAPTPGRARSLTAEKPRPAVARVALAAIRLPPQSALRVEGDLGRYPWLTRPEVPPITHSNLVGDTVIQVTVHPEGFVYSAIVLESCGLKTADRQALEIARAARFRLPTTNRPEALPTSGWTWGRLIFEWLTRAPEPVSLSAGRSS